MEKIKRVYYYFFYKIYKSIEYTSEMFGGKFWSDLKTGIVVMVLEFWIVISLFNYYNVFIDKNFHFSKSIYITVVILFSILTYFTIDHTEIWKEYNKEFDKLPKERNKKGSWVVFGIILIIIANFIFSLYLLYQMRRS